MIWTTNIVGTVGKIFVITEIEHHCDDRPTIKVAYADRNLAVKAMHSHGFNIKISDNGWMNSCKVVRQITECELI